MNKIRTAFIHVIFWLLFYVSFMLYKYSKPEHKETDEHTTATETNSTETTIDSDCPEELPHE